MNNYCDFQTYDATTCGYYIIKWTKFTDVLKVTWIRIECNPPGIIPTGTLLCEAKCCNSMSANYFCYHEPHKDLTVLVKINKGIHVNFTITGLCAGYHIFIFDVSLCSHSVFIIGG